MVHLLTQPQPTAALYRREVEAEYLLGTKLES